MFIINPWYIPDSKGKFTLRNSQSIQRSNITTVIERFLRKFLKDTEYKFYSIRLWYGANKIWNNLTIEAINEK